MPLYPGWEELAFRLLLALIAGAVIGFNRGETGHQAGLRTTILVCLAAAIAMMQANVLLPMTGKAHDSFTIIDLGRWPLGILTGVGFIGAGAVFRRGAIVQGVTTAATMWFVTVIGLCFGGGQLGLGIAGTAVGMFVLWAVKCIDDRMSRLHRARLIVISNRDIDVEHLIRGELPERRFKARMVRKVFGEAGKPNESQYEIRWMAPAGSPPPLASLERLRAEEGVCAISWRL